MHVGKTTLALCAFFFQVSDCFLYFRVRENEMFIKRALKTSNVSSNLSFLFGSIDKHDKLMILLKKTVCTELAFALRRWINGYLQHLVKKINVSIF